MIARKTFLDYTTLFLLMTIKNGKINVSTLNANMETKENVSLDFRLKK